MNSKEKKWKKQIQQDISNFQADGIEYPTSSILQQLGTGSYIYDSKTFGGISSIKRIKAIDQCQDEYLKAQRQVLTSQLSSGTRVVFIYHSKLDIVIKIPVTMIWKPKSVIKHLKTRTKLSDGLPKFFGANQNKSYSRNGIGSVSKHEDVPNENDFKSRDHKANDSGYSTPEFKSAEVKNDLNEAKSTSAKPKNWKDFLEELETKKESAFNEYQKDYESKIEFELKNRISIFRNEIEPSLNVEVNKSRTAKCIEKSKYLSPDMAYWNAKITQVRFQKYWSMLTLFLVRTIRSRSCIQGPSGGCPDGSFWRCK